MGVGTAAIHGAEVASPVDLPYNHKMCPTWTVPFGGAPGGLPSNLSSDWTVRARGFSSLLLALCGLAPPSLAHGRHCGAESAVQLSIVRGDALRKHRRPAPAHMRFDTLCEIRSVDMFRANRKRVGCEGNRMAIRLVDDCLRRALAIGALADDERVGRVGQRSGEDLGARGRAMVDENNVLWAAESADFVAAEPASVVPTAMIGVRDAAWHVLAQGENVLAARKEHATCVNSLWQQAALVATKVEDERRGQRG